MIYLIFLGNISSKRPMCNHLFIIMNESCFSLFHKIKNVDFHHLDQPLWFKLNFIRKVSLRSAMSDHLFIVINFSPFSLFHEKKILWLLWSKLIALKYFTHTKTLMVLFPIKANLSKKNRSKLKKNQNIFYHERDKTRDIYDNTSTVLHAPCSEVFQTNMNLNYKNFDLNHTKWF